LDLKQEKAEAMFTARPATAGLETQRTPREPSVRLIFRSEPECEKTSLLVFHLIQASLLRLLLRQQAAPSVGFLSGL